MLKKHTIVLLSLFMLATVLSGPVFATNENELSLPVQCVKPTINPYQVALIDVWNKYLKYSNEHNLEALKTLYASNFVNGDGMKKDDLMSLTKETWQNCPDIQYTSTLSNIYIDDNYATIESVDYATSQHVKKSDITNDLGVIEGNSRSITYFQRYGKDWKIISDRVNYESTSIKYGSAKNIPIKFTAQQQASAGETYTSSLFVNLPQNAVAFASISKEPIVYPQTKTNEVFRQVNPDTGLLERVMKANLTNNNELSSCSVGITELSNGNYADPKVKLTGLAILFQRVNIVPKNAYKPEPISKNSEEFADEEQLLNENVK